jgi:hypothetical protein
MPRVAPGDIVRGALRRKLPEYIRVSVRYSDRYLPRYPYRLVMETSLHLCKSRSKKCSYFTLHLSGFGIERGRLGEVVSLVGDCRPPPPGNPHRPSTPDCISDWVGMRYGCPAHTGSGSIGFTSNKQKYGGVFLPVWMGYSFNNTQLITNLKDLIPGEYFKNYRSYFSCTEKNPVLKFEHFHSHLCGFRKLEPPSIAITNVLGT